MNDTLISLLKTCGETRDFWVGARVHADILKKGLLIVDPLVGINLVCMYVRCGERLKAEELFEDLSVRDVVCWSNFILEYLHGEHDKEALSCFERMLHEGLYPDAGTLFHILKACAHMGALDMVRNIDSQIARQGLLAGHVALGGALVDRYARCGALEKAKEVLMGLSVRSVILWSILIARYVQAGYGIEALNCYSQMLCEGFFPDAVAFVSILQACGSVGALSKGRSIHLQIINRELIDRNIILGNALVDMYTKCGALANAKEVLERLSVRDVVSWSSLIAGYVQGELGKEALNCHERMLHEGICPNAITFTCTLIACGIVGVLETGEKIHSEIINQGLLSENIMLGNALIHMYVKCGALDKAKEELEALPIRDVISWSTLIAGYVQGEYAEEALNCVESMQSEGFSADEVTFACILRACGSTGALEKGINIHADIVRQGLLDGNILLANALIDMYASCGVLANAKTVLQGLPIRDAVTWSTLITGYVQEEHIDEVFNCFEQMQHEGFAPTEVTYNCVLQACGSVGALDKGEKIHSEIIGQRFLSRNVALGCALVDMYAKCGALGKAKVAIEGLPVRGVVCWSALIAGYAQAEQGKEALSCYERMQSEGVFPNVVTFICILKACASIGALKKGGSMHCEIIRQGLLGEQVALGNALVDMYAKCGALVKAREVLEGLPVRNAVSWNALVAGYARGEHGKEALCCIQQMQCEGFFPNEVTFLCLLSACSRLGLLETCLMYFRRMRRDYGILPKLQHHTCVINLFGKVGLLEEAATVMDEMPSSNTHTLWFALLTACKKWGNTTLAMSAFKHAAQLDVKATT